MTAEAHTGTSSSTPKQRGGASVGNDGSYSHRRSIRNLILQPGLQLKYTGMVVAVTVLVAGALGHLAYNYSKGQTQLLSIQRMADAEQQANQQGEALEPAVYEDVLRYAEEEDRRVLAAIVLGILALALAVGGTGIVITHRLVGPVYRLKYLFAAVRDGYWRANGTLRKHDELQDLFVAYQDMLAGLRKQREEELAHVDQVVGLVQEQGGSDEVVAEIGALRERLQRVIQR